MRKKKEEKRNKEVKFVIPLNVPNKCNVIYSEDAMKPAIEEYLEKNKGKAMLGSLNPNLEHYSTVSSFINVSHQITDLKIEDDGIYGRALLLDTPMGKVVQGLNDESSLTFAPNVIGHIKTEKQDDGSWCQKVIDCSIISIDII